MAISSNSQNVFSNAEDRWKKEIGGIETFRLLDQFSEAHTLSDYSHFESIHLVQLNHQCLAATVRSAHTLLKKMKKSKVIFIDSSGDYKKENYAHLKDSVLNDSWQFLAKKYQLMDSGQFVTFSNSNGKVTHSGKLQGQKSDNCAVQFYKISDVKFHSDILRTFSHSCMECHMKYDGIDYFSSMKKIQEWSTMSSKAMESFRMPMGGIDPDLYPVQGIKNSNELKLLYLWLSSGASFTQEDEDHLQNARKRIVEFFNKKDSRLPDLALEMKEVHSVPALGSAYYNSSVLIESTQADEWIEYAKFNSNLEVLHHSNLHHVNQSSFQGMDKESSKGKNLLTGVSASDLKKIDVFYKGKNIGGTLINENDLFGIGRKNGLSNYPKGLAVFIPKGSKIVVQNHYNPSGRQVFNQTKVDLFRIKDPSQARIVKRFFVLPNDFYLEPFKKNQKVISKIKIDKDISMISFYPHMHYRGKGVKLFLIQENTKSKLLIASVPFYRLKYEQVLVFEKPLFIPKNSTLEIVADYDNSIQNSANPDPSKRIKLGYSTYDSEMHSMRIAYIEGQY